MPPDALEFSDSESAYSVWVSSNAIQSMLIASAKAGRYETGGILIGRYDSEGWIAEVVEATGMPKGSSAGWRWFKRGNDGLKNILRERWALGHHYLGEWHFHPNGTPTPSKVDNQSMWKIAADAAYQCPVPLLLIIGGSVPDSWSISASVYLERTHLRLRA